MPFPANVVTVMIAFPGDAAAAADAVRDAITEWNAVHTEVTGIVLRPITWRSRSAPEVSGRAQDIVNRQVLDRADLLIGVFGAKIGSPTGDYASGTVEEIERHVETGKLAMVYFSSEAIERKEFDAKQFARLQKFRDDLHRRGLCDDFASLDLLKGKVDKHLSIQIQDRFSNLVQGGKPSPVKNSLAAEAVTLLIEAAKDQHGIVTRIRDSGGLIVRTNGKCHNIRKDAKSEAAWSGALDDLLEAGLMKSRGTGGLFEVTRAGFEAAGSLASKSDESELSAAAAALLEQTSRDDAQLSIVETMHGEEWKAGGKMIASSPSPRVLADMEAHVKELIDKGLLELVNQKPGQRRYKVTRAGFIYTEKPREPGASS